jgi:hypothetical protein
VNLVVLSIIEIVIQDFFLARITYFQYLLIFKERIVMSGETSNNDYPVRRAFCTNGLSIGPEGGSMGKRNEDPNDEPLERSFDMGDNGALEEALEELGLINKDLAEVMREELQEAIEDKDHSVVMVGTDGDVTVTIIHVPKSSLDNRIGPVILPTTNRYRVTAAISQEMVFKKIAECERVVDPLIAQRMWENFLEKQFERVIKKLELEGIQVISDVIFDED